MPYRIAINYNMPNKMWEEEKLKCEVLLLLVRSWCWQLTAEVTLQLIPEVTLAVIIAEVTVAVNRWGHTGNMALILLCSSLSYLLLCFGLSVFCSCLLHHCCMAEERRRETLDQAREAVHRVPHGQQDLKGQTVPGGQGPLLPPSSHNPVAL